MKGAATPLFGSDIPDGLREVPMVAVKVPSIVLALAVRVIFGFSQDDRSVLPRAFAVTLGILDANLNDVRMVGRHSSFGNRNAPLAHFHLDAVIGNSETDGKPKCLS